MGERLPPLRGELAKEADPLKDACPTAKALLPSRHPDQEENKRYRDPIVQAEVTDRVKEYAAQVEQDGHIVHFRPGRC